MKSRAEGERALIVPEGAPRLTRARGRQVCQHRQIAVAKALAVDRHRVVAAAVLEVAAGESRTGAVDVGGDLIGCRARFQDDTEASRPLLRIDVGDGDDILLAKIAVSNRIGARRRDLPDRDDVLTIVAGEGRGVDRLRPDLPGRPVRQGQR